MAYDDDDATTDGPGDWASRRDVLSDVTKSPARFMRSPRKPLPRPVTADATTTADGYEPGVKQLAPAFVDDQDCFDNPPSYFPHLWRRAEARDRLVLTRQTLEVWRDAAEAVRQRNDEARADALYALRLKRKVLKQCLAVFQDLYDAQIQADEIYTRRLAGTVLGKTCDEYRVRRIRSIEEDRVKGVSLYKWAIASREARFIRKRDHDLKQAVMRKLIEEYRRQQRRQNQLEELLSQRQSQESRELLKSAVSFLSHKTQAITEKANLAEGINRNALYQSSIKIWEAQTTNVQNLQTTADDAREYFLMKNVIDKMKAAAEARKDRREQLAKWAFSRWQIFAKNKRHTRYDELYKQFRKTVKLKLARKCLQSWRTKLQDIQRIDGHADDVYNSSLSHRILRPVLATTFSTADWMSKSGPAADQVADQFLQKRVLTAIQMQHQTLFENEDRANRLHQYRVEQKAVQGLRQMQLRAFELQRRIADADAFRSRHDKRLVRTMLAHMRTKFAFSRRNGEEQLTLTPAPAITPARKRQQLFNDSTRLSTTPAYTPFITPFMAKLKNEPRILEDIEDMDESMFEGSLQDLDDIDTEPGG